MGSPEKPIDVELADMNPEVTMKSEKAELEPLNSPEKNEESVRFTGLTKEELMGMLNASIISFKDIYYFLLVYINLNSFTTLVFN